MTDNNTRIRKIFLGMGVLILVTAITLVIAWQFSRHAVTESLSFPEERIVVACTDTFPPFELRDENGDHIGYARDISTEVARELGCAIEHRMAAQWAEALEWLKNGKVDLIHLIAYSPERDEHFDFTIPHTLVPEVIFVRSERRDILGLSDFKDKQIGAVRLHITYEKLLKYKDLNIVVFETAREGVEALLDGKVDAFAYPQFVFEYLVQQMGREDEIKIVGEPLGDLRYCMAVREGDHVLLSYLDRAIQRIEASGKRDEIVQRWFGRKVFRGLTREEVLSLIGWVVFGLLVTSLGGLAYVYVRYKLRKAEAVLRHNLIFQHMDDSVILTSLHGKITDWNPGAERMFGHSREDILGRRLDFLLAPGGSTERFETVIREVQADGIWSGEIRAVRKDGRRVVCSVSATALRNEKGDRIAYVSILRDITEHMQAEENLKEQKEFSEKIISTSNAIIVGLDKNHKIRLFNKGAEQITGYKIKDVMGKDWFKMFFMPELLDEMNKVWKEAWGVEFHSYINPIRTKNGEKRIISWQTAGLYEGEDEKKHIMISIGEDITERKHAEEELRKHREHLEELVEKRTEELKEKTDKIEESRKALTYLVEDVNEARKNLEKANERLKELDRLKSMFIASMSHELRTPLNSIIGFTGIILQGMTGEINPEQKDQLQRVYGSGKHLLALINDVIDISKIEAGKVEVYAEEVNLNGVIKEAVSNLKPEIENKAIGLEISLLPDLQLTTDRKRLLQCVLNYLSNAVKFTEKGKIEIAAHEVDGMMEISVKDTGIGIKEEDIPKLFKSFVRLDTPLKVTTSGTGLGLYLTKKLATEVLKGSVSVESKYGEGSTFVLRVAKEI